MDKDRFEIQNAQGNIFSTTKVMIIVDKETGVNYMYVANGNGGGLTPLIDKDGKPVITKNTSGNNNCCEH